MVNEHLPPILFIHGAWHGKWCYEHYFCDYFRARGLEVHAIDLPGHGEQFTSTRDLRWLTISDYVDAVAAYVARFKTPPALVGHSMGGFVVQKYLERHKAAAGVLLASIPPRGVARLLLAVARRQPLRLLKVNLTLSLAPLIDTQAQVRHFFFSENISPDVLRLAVEKLHDESYRAFLDYLGLDLPLPERVETPLLVLGAANDTIFTQREVRQTAAAYGTEATIFPNMAHDMMLEPGWQHVAEKIIEWLSEIAGQGRIHD